MDVRYEKGKLQHYDQNNKKWYDVGSGVGSGDFAMNQNYDVNATDLVIPGCVEYVKDRLFSLDAINYGTSSSGSYRFGGNTSNREFYEGREVINPSLRHVTFEEGVKQIGFKAFYNQLNLDRIDFPDSLEWVHPLAFYGTPWFNRQPYGPVYCGKVFYCYKFPGLTGDSIRYPLTSQITIKEGTKSISSLAFEIESPYNDGTIQGISRINLPESLIGIGDYAFRYIRSNMTINIPDAVTWIGVGAFMNTRLNINSLPTYLWEIKARTFQGATGLGSLKLPKHTKYIGQNAFSGSDISDNFFKDDGAQVWPPVPSIPYELEYIDNNAFTTCTSLTTAKLPEGVKHIGSYCFNGCSLLRTVHLPSSLTNIANGNRIFESCPNLAVITVGENFNCDLNLMTTNNLSTTTAYSKQVLEKIIDNLANRTGLKTGKLTIGSNSINNISEEKRTLASNKNWSLT